MVCMEENSPLKVLKERFSQPPFALTILAVFTFVVYAGTLSFAFVWDDFPQVVDNPLIRSWRTLPSVFRSDLWFGGGRDQVYYRPFFITWETLTYAVFRLQTWGWHFVTVLLHIGASLSVYWLARKLKLEYWIAAAAALIFAFHPVHTEVASWVSAGSDSLVTILYIAAFWAFLNAAESPSRKWLWWFIAVTFSAMACFTKEMGVTFPVMVAIYTWLNDPTNTRLKKFWRSAAAALPFFLITLAYLILRHFALVRSVKIDTTHSIGDMLITLPVVLITYLRILLFPAGLNAFYFTHYVDSLVSWSFILPLTLLVALVALFIYWAHKKRDRVVTFLSLWMLVTLVPVLYLRGFPPGDFVRDRYIYLPSVAFAILVAMSLKLLPSPISKINTAEFQTTVVVMLSIVLAFGCVLQQTYWANDLLVSYRGYKLSPESEYGAVNLAGALIERRDFQHALPIIQEHIAKNPGKSSSYHLLYSLALIYLETGHLEEGRATLRQALAQLPEFVESDSGAAGLIGLLGRAKDYDDALRLCSQLLSKQSGKFTALYNCGIANYESGHPAQAKQLLEQAERIAPGKSSPVHFLGRIAFQEHQYGEAETYFKAAIASEPAGPEYHYWLGQSLEADGRIEEAKREYALELQYNPRYEPASKRLLELQKN